MNEFTTSSELFRLAKKIGVPLAWVGAKDEFSPSGNARSKQGYIINMQSSDEGPGTHWVCVFISPSTKKSYYFDSFGQDVPATIERRIKECGLKSPIRSTRIIQDINGGYCGQYCLAFLKAMCARGPFLGSEERCLKAFELLWSDDPKKNQERIRKWSRLYLV